MGFEGAKKCVEYHRSDWTYLICWLLSKSLTFYFVYVSLIGFRFISIKVNLQLWNLVLQRGNTSHRSLCLLQFDLWVIMQCRLVNTWKTLPVGRSWSNALFIYEWDKMDNSCTQRAKGPNVSSRSTPFCSRSLESEMLKAIIKPVRWAFTCTLFSVLKFWPVKGGCDKRNKGRRQHAWTSTAEHFQFSQSSFSDLIKGETARKGPCGLFSQGGVRMCQGGMWEVWGSSQKHPQTATVCLSRLEFLRSDAFVVNNQHGLLVKSCF